MRLLGQTGRLASVSFSQAADPFGAGGQPVLLTQGDRLDAVFDGIVVCALLRYS
jgi:hypothetical protein